jgi:hypothetical protein
MIKIRIIYTVLTLVTLGVAPYLFRHWSLLPNWVNFWLGDFLFGVLLFWAAMILFVHANRRNVAIVLMIYCAVVETSQLYHAEWLDALRQTAIGGGILGHHFEWSDLLGYVSGVAFAYWMDRIGFRSIV